MDFVCTYMRDRKYFKRFVRVNLQVPAGSAKDPNWYAFPVPTVYHGLAAGAPARTRPRGRARYLWSHSSGLHGKAQNLRRALGWECRSSKLACAPSFSVPQEDPGDPKRTWLFNVKGMVNAMLSSTFCAQPPGDTPLRKGIVDSIVFGCIPVLFVPQQLVIWRAHLTEEEMLSMCVYVPEDKITGARLASIYTKACNRSQNEECPQTPSENLEPILAAIGDEEIRAKQDSMAALAYRVTLQLSDTGEQDSLRMMLEAVAAKADAAGDAPSRRAFAPQRAGGAEGLGFLEADAAGDALSRRVLPPQRVGEEAESSAAPERGDLAPLAERQGDARHASGGEGADSGRPAAAARGCAGSPGDGVWDYEDDLAGDAEACSYYAWHSKLQARRARVPAPGSLGVALPVGPPALLEGPLHESLAPGSGGS